MPSSEIRKEIPFLAPCDLTINKSKMVESDGIVNSSGETELETKQRVNRRINEKKDATSTDLKKSSVNIYCNHFFIF